jgi:Na+-translocating ferredoxin:NAD+ oxidoreductase subunit D
MNLQVSSSPHIRDHSKTSVLMRDVIIALVPTFLASVYFFGLRSVWVVFLTVISAVITEAVCRKIMKRYNSIYDLSAVVTGMLLALSFPPTIPWWICIVGAFIAIAVVKQMFGGIGNNFVNPAIAARIVLTVSFPSQMSRWTILSHIENPIKDIPGSVIGTDLVTTATPLDLLSKGAQTLPDYWQIFIGYKGGCLGEVSVLALLIGATYLLFRHVIKPWIPLAFIGTTILLVALGGKDPLYHALSGGLIIGAFFMATDYVTSPLTNKGKLIFGFGCGLITGLIRLFGGMVEGVSFSILIMNIVTPHIDRLTIPIPFGGGRKRAKKTLRQ